MMYQTGIGFDTDPVLLSRGIHSCLLAQPCILAAISLGRATPPRGWIPINTVVSERSPLDSLLHTTVRVSGIK